MAAANQKSSDERLKLFRRIIPVELDRELGNAIMENDSEKVRAIVDEKINPILDKYVAETKNMSMNPGEQTLWVHEVSKGVFHKETVEKWVITNLRAFRFYPQTKDSPQGRLAAIGLAISDTVVMNQYRSSKGNRVGTFSGVGGGVFAGSSVSQSRSTSRAYGDLVFLFDGKEALRFQGISDPQGVRRMVETIKKQERT